MHDKVEPLILDLLEWIGETPRPYAEVMDAWRTSCPRLPVWEDAVDRGLVVRQVNPGGAQMVALTPAGCSFLAASTRRRRTSASVAVTA